MNRRIRIALIAPYPASAVLPPDVIRPRYQDREHPASWVRALGRGLAARPDVELKVFVHSRAITRIRTGSEAGIPFVFIPKIEPARLDPWHFYLPGWLQLKRHIALFDADVVHGFGTESGCGALAVMQGFPSIVSVQGIMSKLAALSRADLPRLTMSLHCRIERETLRRATLVMVENNFAGEWVRAFRPSQPLEVIPHAVNPEFFSAIPDYGSKTIISIGTPGLTKGTDILLRAFAYCRDPEARLLIIGTSKHIATYREWAVELGVQDRVNFMGRLDRAQIISLLQSARFAVLASRMDTSPNVVTEAHAAGLAVVATQTGGIPEMIDHERDGLLVPAENPERMADAMNKLLADGDLCRRMGQQGRKKVLTLNDPDRIAGLHVTAYRRAIQQYLATARPGDDKLPARPARLQSWVAPLKSFAGHQRLTRRLASLVPPAARAGTTYWYWRRFLDNAQRWPNIKIEAWQMDRLRQLVRYAYERTEGYRSLYRAAGIVPDDIRTMDDFRRLPLLKRSMLQGNLEAFSVPLLGRIYVTTGGSTGIPLGFYTGSKNRQIEAAFMHSSWAWAGWKLGMVSAVLRGAFVGSEEYIWKYDPYHRELSLSSYYLTERTLPRYIDVLLSVAPPVLQAYPSSLNLLCDLLQNAGRIGEIRFRLILLGSENIYDWQLQKFAETFPGARLFAWYGHAEQVILAPWCEHARTYHARPFYGLTELLDQNDREVEVGMEGELVGTNFHNLATPLIRYRTMDRAVRGVSPCPACGRHFPILDKISGRSHEVIVTGRGRFISMTAINMHDDIFDGLLQFQFFQDTKGKVTFKYVPRRVLTPRELERIHNGLMAKLGDDVHLTLTAVARIPRTPSGKFRFLDQQLPIRYGDREP